MGGAAWAATFVQCKGRDDRDIQAIVIDDRAFALRLVERRIDRIAEVEIEGFVRLRRGVANDRDADLAGGLPEGNRQRAGRGDVVGSGGGGTVAMVCGSIRLAVTIFIPAGQSSSRTEK